MFQKRLVLAMFFVIAFLTPFTPQAQVAVYHTSTTSAFRLPVAAGLKVSVSQGNNDSQHDHIGKAAWAFDFIVGTTNFVVTAAQAGTVIGADDSSSTGCADVGCWTQANYVLIADDDGKTAALYLHLLHNSLKVKPGMHVSQGDPLGLADTTGWTTGPHLHFQVEDIPSVVAKQQHYPGWWWTQSVPISFSNPEVLAQNPDGVPKADQSPIVVSNPPVASSLPTAAPSIVPTLLPTLPPTAIPTPPTPLPVPTPTPTLTLPSQFQGTLVQAPTTFQVALQITQTHMDGSFDGKWYAKINGSEEDVIVNGVVVPFNESNRFSQISQDKVQQLEQQFGSNGTLLWFTSTSYDVGQDIWLGSEYYGSLQTNGSVQGIWYPPGSSSEGGTFQLASS